MESPEHSPERIDHIISETGERLHELFREGYHEADIKASRTFYRPGAGYTEYPMHKSAAEEARMEVWEANELLANKASRGALEKALVLLDTAVAIHNDPKYRKLRQTVVRRLGETES